MTGTGRATLAGIGEAGKSAAGATVAALSVTIAANRIFFIVKRPNPAMGLTLSGRNDLSCDRRATPRPKEERKTRTPGVSRPAVPAERFRAMINIFKQPASLRGAKRRSNPESRSRLWIASLRSQ